MVDALYEKRSGILPLSLSILEHFMNEKVQWLIVALIMIGFLGFGGYIVKQEAQFDHISTALQALTVEVREQEFARPAAQTNTSTTASTPSDAWVTRSWDRERFQISYAPTLQPVVLDKGSDDEGRIGTIGINRTGMGNDDLVSIHVYKDKAALEADFSAWDGGSDPNKKVFMGSSGLQKKTLTINGRPVPVFYGMHAIDGVGGQEFAEVNAVVVGPTYAYLIQFHDMGTSPESADIQKYLHSFQLL